jgi:uncharacterized membrane protein HdeD (DUF308 family)
MEESLARNWWVLALRGVLAILFGVLAFLWPVLAWVVVVASFAVFALVDGIFALLAAFTGRGQGRWWALMLEGVLGIAAGVLTFIWPGITQLALLFFIAYWSIVTGVLEIVVAIRLRKEIEGEWLMGISGALSILLGVALLILPGPGALALAWLIAAYSLAFGALMLALAFRLRTLPRAERTPATTGQSVPVR